MGGEISLPGADLHFISNGDWGAPANALLKRLAADIPWRQERITLFGRTYMQPRLICWMGDPGCIYAYSGKSWEPEPWHPLVLSLKARVESYTETRFNAVLLNYYRDGLDSMGLHADDEPELGPRPIIASLSLGANRVMHFRHRHDRAAATHRIDLTDGSLLIMRGDTQANWKHAIPKTRKSTGPRINLTFRRIMV